MKIATQKISEPWASIGTVLGQPTINDYTFYLKKFKAKNSPISQNFAQPQYYTVGHD